MATITHPGSARSPWRAAWHAAHDPVVGVPSWARIAAVAIPLVVLPASVWHIVVVNFFPPDASGASQAEDLPSWLPVEVYVVLLSVFSELVAFTAIGLIAGWGQVFPRWIPWLRGRTVPFALAVIPATIASVVLTGVTVTGLVSNASGRTITGEPLPDNYPLHFRDLEGAVSVAAYAPLLLWGPLLAAVTVAYWRRRRRWG